MKKITFADNLRSLRKSKKWTQKDLAQKVGVDQRTVSAWENGICEPSYNLLAHLCELFNETFDSMLSD